MKAKGYISSRTLNNGKVYEQSIQNLVIRNYCDKIKYKFILSGTEYSMKNSFLTLNQIYSDIKEYDAIVFFSYHQLPSYRFYYKNFKKIINMNKKLFFAFENIEISKEENLLDFINLNKIDYILNDCIKSLN